jgi:hypothetical protein
MHPNAALAVQSAIQSWMSLGWCAANPHQSVWALAYNLAYQAAAERARQERLSELFWEPNLN